MAHLKIGQVAREAAVSVDTVRFYERRGILPAPARLASGYRVYNEEAIKTIRKAKVLQALGMTLDEIVDALASVSGESSCASQSWRLELVLKRLDEQLRILQGIRDEAASARDACVARQCDLFAGCG